jgi:endogenous inhibitor of DNA gyrase (YacG/DUF329 family)
MATEKQFTPKCPTCDISTDPAVNASSFPFCSERCRMIDLGRWLNEEHRLTCEAEDEEDDAEQSTAPQLPPGWHDA